MLGGVRSIVEIIVERKRFPARSVIKPTESSYLTVNEVFISSEVFASGIAKYKPSLSPAERRGEEVPVKIREEAPGIPIFELSKAVVM